MLSVDGGWALSFWGWRGLCPTLLWQEGLVFSQLSVWTEVALGQHLGDPGSDERYVPSENHCSGFSESHHDIPFEGKRSLHPAFKTAALGH